MKIIALFAIAFLNLVSCSSNKVHQETKHYFELGAGVTPIIVSGDFTSDSKTFTSTFGHLNFGYRYQPITSGFTFRAFITPIFGEFGFLPYYGGVSFGYKF